MKQGDLIHFLKEKQNKPGSQHSQNGLFPVVNDMELWHILRQVCAGIRYLHHQNVVHGDIKPQVCM